MGLKKWMFGIGLSTQIVIIAVMVFLLKGLHQEVEEYDPYPDNIAFVEESVQEEPLVPFACYVQGNGKVIPSSNYVKVGSPFNGTVKDVYVSVGQKVSEGDLLFKIDDSLLCCQLAEKQSEMRTMIAKLEITQKGPDNFDVLLKEKEIAQAKANHDMHKKEHELLLALYEKDAISSNELHQKISLVNTMSSQLERILVEYEKMKSGPSDHEQKLGQALIEEKLANCKTIEKQIENCNIRAPIEGRIFAVNTHPGEFCDTGKGAAISMGSDEPLHLRVLVDKKEAWKVNPSPQIRAIASHPSNPKMQFLLEYVMVNPCFADGEYLELVFAFDRQKNPVYLDETLDVYIEASNASLLDYQFSHMRH